MSSSRPIHSFLAGMEQRHIDLLYGVSLYAEFGGGDVIFREGSPAHSFYLIEHGRVALEADMNGKGLVQIEVLQDGAPLGWSWLFPPHMWHFHARALARTTVTYFDGKILRRLCEEDRDFGYELMKRISQVMLERLQSTRCEMLKIYCGPQSKNP